MKVTMLTDRLAEIKARAERHIAENCCWGDDCRICQAAKGTTQLCAALELAVKALDKLADRLACFGKNQDLYIKSVLNDIEERLK